MMSSEIEALAQEAYRRYAGRLAREGSASISSAVEAVLTQQAVATIRELVEGNPQLMHEEFALRLGGHKLTSVYDVERRLIYHLVTLRVETLVEIAAEKARIAGLGG